MFFLILLHDSLCIGFMYANHLVAWHNRLEVTVDSRYLELAYLE